VARVGLADGHSFVAALDILDVRFSGATCRFPSEPRCAGRTFPVRRNTLHFHSQRTITVVAFWHFTCLPTPWCFVAKRTAWLRLRAAPRVRYR